MGKWLKNPGTGENPIPGAKAGTFWVRFRDRAKVVAIHDADRLYWSIGQSKFDILEYRLIDPN